MEQWLQDHPNAVTGLILLVLVSAVLASGTYFLARRPAPAPIVIEMATPPATNTPRPSPDPEPIVVYVVGEVRNPGVYTIPWDSRVVHAIEAAGGASDQADLVRVNLASRVGDGQQLYVPRCGEASTPVLPTAVLLLSAEASSSEGNKVNINLAAADVLEGLPGIGPAIAGRIVQYRADNGPFEDIRELQRVRGIGEVIFSQVEDLVTVD